MSKITKPKLYAGQVPWNKQGAMGYPESWHGQTVEWRDNIPFEVSLKATTFSRGRSSAKLELKDSDGLNYEMFLTDVADIIQNVGIRKGGGPINGWWAIAKRGQNYGIIYLGKDNPVGIP